MLFGHTLIKCHRILCCYRTWAPVFLNWCLRNVQYDMMGMLHNLAEIASHLKILRNKSKCGIMQYELLSQYHSHK